MTSEEREATYIVLSHVQEYVFDDNPREHSTCPSCGWDSATDGQGVIGFDHKPGRKLRSAIDVLSRGETCT